MGSVANGRGGGGQGNTSMDGKGGIGLSLVALLGTAKDNTGIGGINRHGILVSITLSL